MSQISNALQNRPLDGEPVLESRPSAVEGAPVQMRHDFDAAMRRADSRESDDEDDKPEAEEANAGLSALGQLVSIPSGSAGALAGPSQSLGGGAPAALPGTHGGALPDAVPLAGGHAGMNAVGQQFRVSVPVEGTSAASLGMRLVHTGAGHWQMRLASDTLTRQQLAPHLDKLRDKLRERSGGRFDDLGFEDDHGTPS